MKKEMKTMLETIASLKYTTRKSMLTLAGKVSTEADEMTDALRNAGVISLAIQPPFIGGSEEKKAIANWAFNLNAHDVTGRTRTRLVLTPNLRGSEIRWTLLRDIPQADKDLNLRLERVLLGHLADHLNMLVASDNEYAKGVLASPAAIKANVKEFSVEALWHLQAKGESTMVQVYNIIGVRDPDDPKKVMQDPGYTPGSKQLSGLVKDEFASFKPYFAEYADKRIGRETPSSAEEGLVGEWLSLIDPEIISGAMNELAQDIGHESLEAYLTAQAAERGFTPRGGAAPGQSGNRRVVNEADAAELDAMLAKA